MVLEPKLQRVYREIQKQLFYIIPEKWSKVYLYSSILERSNNLDTGELYFYYIPKGVLKKKPVNVYEIPNKFSIEEKEYLKLVDKLYKKIKELQQISVELEGEKWNSIIISIADFKFEVEYNYDEDLFLEFNSYEKHLIFRYKYLRYPLSSYNKKEQDIIIKYENIINNNKPKIKTYSEAMYELPYEVIEENTKSANIQFVKEEELEATEEKEIKSQILKSGY